MSIEEDLATVGVSVYPNPTQNRLNVQLTEQMKGDVKISLLNQIGEEVLTQDLPSVLGNTSQAIDISTLPTGVYILRVANQDYNVVKRILKK